MNNIVLHIRGGKKVMPPNFPRKYNCNNNESYKDDDSRIFRNYEAIFPQILRHFQHTFADVE
jgi:hypothetical protein